MTISQAGKKRIPTNKLDYFVHNKPSEVYPNTLAPIYSLRTFVYIYQIYIYTLRDKNPSRKLWSYCVMVFTTARCRATKR